MTLKIRIKKEPHELLYVTISCMVFMSAICDSMFASILPGVVSIFYSIMTLLRIFLCVEAFIIIFKRGIKKIDILFIIIYMILSALSAILFIVDFIRRVLVFCNTESVLLGIILSLQPSIV